MGQPRVPDTIRQAAINDYLAGIPVTTIATKYGIGPSTPGHWARRAGLPRRRQARRQALRKTVITEYTTGRHLEDIAADHNISTSTIRDWAREAGVYRNRRLNPHRPRNPATTPDPVTPLPDEADPIYRGDWVTVRGIKRPTRPARPTTANRHTTSTRSTTA